MLAGGVVMLILFVTAMGLSLLVLGINEANRKW